VRVESVSPNQARLSSLLSFRVPTWVPLAVFTLLFVIGRMWFFLDFPIPIVQPDSASYMVVSDQIRAGELPRFGDRSPLYPIFLSLAFEISERIMSVVVAQSLLSLVAGLTLIYAFLRLFPIGGLLLSFALGAFFMDSEALGHDTAVLTESLYTSIMMVATALFILAMSVARPRQYVLFGSGSALYALVIFLKPGALYLVPIVTIFSLYLLFRGRSWRLFFSCLLPFVTLVVGLATYNKMTIDSFAVSTSDATEITFVTNMFWESDSSYPEEINEAISRVQATTSERLTPEEREILLNSWDLQSLYPLYLRGHYYGPQSEIAAVTDGWGTPEWRSWLLKISRDNIRSHPEAFFKHFTVMLYYYYRSFLYSNEFRPYLLNRVKLFYVDNHFGFNREDPQMATFGKEFADPQAPPPTVSIQESVTDPQVNLQDAILLEETPATQIYLVTFGLLGLLFFNPLWVLIQPLILILSIVRLAWSKLHHDGAAVLLLLVLLPLGNASIVSAVEYSQPRYSYPLEWAYFAAVFASPFLLRRFSDLLDSIASSGNPSSHSLANSSHLKLQPHEQNRASEV
jgi:hypothetical protein